MSMTQVTQRAPLRMITRDTRKLHDRATANVPKITMLSPRARGGATAQSVPDSRYPCCQHPAKAVVQPVRLELANTPRPRVRVFDAGGGRHGPAPGDGAMHDRFRTRRSTSSAGDRLGDVRLALQRRVGRLEHPPQCWCTNRPVRCAVAGGQVALAASGMVWHGAAGRRSAYRLSSRSPIWCRSCRELEGCQDRQSVYERRSCYALSRGPQVPARPHHPAPGTVANYDLVIACPLPRARVARLQGQARDRRWHRSPGAGSSPSIPTATIPA
jgi:hypothetical protein